MIQPSSFHLHVVEPVGFGGSLSRAFGDLRDGVLSFHVWPMLASQEIRRRYRRSVLGPLWLTLSTGIMVGAMGPLYGKLFDQDIGTYFPFLATSLVIWLLISNLVIDSCNAFIATEGLIKDSRLPFTVYVLTVVWRHMLIFLHNFAIVIVVLLAFGSGFSSRSLLALLGLAFVAWNGIWLGLLLGMLCARFRDIPQIVMSLMQIAMFLTPVMWPASKLGRHEWIAQWNPLFHFLEIVRNPLLGQPVQPTTWLAVAAISMAGFAFTMLVFAKYRRRIAYWV
jgi:ABC-type polysaccharide/polyol phosphate export permease